jgi:hypothetical protein
MTSDARIRERIDGECTWLQVPKSLTLQEVYAYEGSSPVINQTLQGWMDWQRRSASSVEQALRAARLAPEFVAALYALDTQFTSADLQAPVSLAEAMGRKAELFNSDWMLEVPSKVPERAEAFEAVSRTPADAPITAAACAVGFDKGKVQSVGLAVTGVQRGGAVPLDTVSLIGKSLSDAEIDSYVDQISFNDNLMENFQGSQEYRLAMVKIVIRRVLQVCAQEGRQQ